MGAIHAYLPRRGGSRKPREEGGFAGKERETVWFLWPCPSVADSRQNPHSIPLACRGRRSEFTVEFCVTPLSLRQCCVLRRNARQVVPRGRPLAVGWEWEGLPLPAGLAGSAQSFVTSWQQGGRRRFSRFSQGEVRALPLPASVERVDCSKQLFLLPLAMKVSADELGEGHPSCATLALLQW